MLITSVTAGVYREVMAKIMARGHSRIPVYDEDKRNLVGVLLVICIPKHCNLVLRLDGLEFPLGFRPFGRFLDKVSILCQMLDLVKVHELLISDARDLSAP